MTSKSLANEIKACYPAGSAVKLIEMGTDPRPVEPGTIGTVVAVDDIGTIHVNWENGRCLGLIPGEDRFVLISKGEKE